MPKHRNPPQIFTIKGNAIHLTGAKKKLSVQEEEQLWAVLSRRHWGRITKALGKAFQLAQQNRRQSVTDNQLN